MFRQIRTLKCWENKSKGLWVKKRHTMFLFLIAVKIATNLYRFYWRQMQLKLGFCLPEKTTDFSHHWPEMLLENCFALFLTLPLPARPLKFMRHKLALLAKLLHNKPKSSFPHADKSLPTSMNAFITWCLELLKEIWGENIHSTLEEAFNAFNIH